MVFKEELGERAGELARRVGESIVEYAPRVVEYMTTEQFPRLVRNIVFLAMVGVMTYTMIRVFKIITPTAEYVAGQFATMFGTIISIMVPIMMIMFIVALIKGLFKVLVG